MGLPPPIKDVSLSGRSQSTDLNGNHSAIAGNSDNIHEASSSFSKPRIKRLVLFAGLIFAILMVQVKIDFLNFFIYDQFFRFRPYVQSSGIVTQIIIDKDTEKVLGHAPDAVDFQKFISQIPVSSRPRHLIFASSILDITGSESQKKQLAEMLTTFPSVMQLTQETVHKEGEKEFLLPSPFEKVKVYSAPKTKDENTLAKDLVTRRIILNYKDVEMVYFPILRSYLRTPDDSTVTSRLSQIPKTTYSLDEFLGESVTTSSTAAALDDTELNGIIKKKLKGSFNFFDSEQLFINYLPKGRFGLIKFEDLLDNEKAPEIAASLEGKVILIGTDLENSFDDYARTPFSREPLAITRTELQANTIETVLRNAAPVQVGVWMNYLLTIIISILTIHIVLTLRPLRGLLILMGMSVSLFIFSGLSFWPFGFWVQIGHPLLAIFICYYFLIPYRLIIENRRSWEYYEKHKLLSEVEKLKTNFIGMMSHDLKTPLARIQGMTDIISNDSHQLSTGQKEAIHSIRSSSEDLLKFINTILNYAKIESQGVQLHLQSKDINDLLKSCLEKHEYFAKSKSIQVIAELEPLFPIKVDPELLKQVFSNLIENAIKYSFPGGKVLVTSEEVNGMIIIQVADQGMGISKEDLPNVFSKFYRSSNAKSSPIKGSGLGLYLAKYFVELHKATISVESEVGKGSTFTVELPI